MVSKPGKTWGDMFSMRNIKQIIMNKHHGLVDPYDILGINNPYQVSTKSIPKSLSPYPHQMSNKRLSPLGRKSLIKSKSSYLPPAVGEVKFKKMNDLCNLTRKSLKKTIKNCKRRNNKINLMFKKCKKIIDDAYEERFNEGLSQDFLKYREKKKAIQGMKLPKNPVLLSLAYP